MTKKEKPLYSLPQNLSYIIKSAWLRDKTVLWVIITQVFLAVTIAVAGIFLPATVVAQIIEQVDLLVLVLTVLAFAAGLTLLNSLNTYLLATAGIRRTTLRVRLSGDLMQKTLTTDFANLGDKDFTDTRQKAMEHISNNNTSTEQVYYTLASIGTNILGFVVYIVLLATINPLIMVVTAITSIFGVVARQKVNKWHHANDTELATPHKRVRYLGDVGRNLSLAKDLRIFGMFEWLKDVYNANVKLAFNFHRKVNLRHFIADAVDIFAAFAREGIAYGYLIWLVLGGGLSVDGFVLMFAAVGGFSGWFSGILNDYASLTMHSLNYCRVRAYLEYPEMFKRDEGDDVPVSDKYELRLKNVSFKYGGADENTLENIDLTIAPGEKLAIVGLNGAGKTTLVKLICGLYDPTEGEVLLNGTDIRDFNRHKYYALFTAVFQEFNILPVTITENISQEPPGVEDSARINECLAHAGLTEKIESLPDGMASLLMKDVHPEAVELSGGETQRLMLARALYKNAPILILDEPTAALDPIAESELYNRYNELSMGRTSVYISHRLASTRFCDRILFLANKGIAEIGTHDELMKKGGSYAELFEIQGKYYREDVE